MRVDLSPNQEAFVRLAIKDGRIASTEDAVQEALQIWERRERRRGEILAAVEVAEQSLSRGEGKVLTEESMRSLAEEVKRQDSTLIDNRDLWLSSSPLRSKPSLLKFGLMSPGKAAIPKLPTG